MIAFLANVGQQEDWKAVEQKALKIGAKKMVIAGESPSPSHSSQTIALTDTDKQKEFVEELAFRAV